MSQNDQHDGAEPSRNGSDTVLKLVNSVISTWRNGQPPDALAFLAEHPRVAEQKSLVLDLAYEEYCLRKENGESVTASDFCEKFPDWNRSLARLIDVHEYLDQHPEFAPVEKEPKWPQAGEAFSGFDIERKIGSGAFARVYVARDPTLGHRPVVLKVSRSGASEAMTLGRLTHDHIVPVNSVNQDAETGLTVICMPYQGEATLVDLLEAGFKAGGRPQTGDVILAVARRRAMSAVEKVEGPQTEKLKRQTYVDAIVGLGIRLAGALKYAHSRGVLHRDLKPSNVLLAPNGEPKLLDFNLSWDPELSGARLGGTVPYMSPEQVKSVLLGKASDQRGGIDQRSDLFSLGVLLYELFTGVAPFGTFGSPGNELQEAQHLLERQRRGARPIHELNPDVDPSLSELVAWCLELEPADRPQTAGDLEARLVAYQQLASRWKRLLNRRRWLVTGVTLALVMLVVTLWIWLANRPPYPVRAYQAGLESYRRGGWQSAVEHWTRAINADRATAKLLFARATAYCRNGEYQLAIDDLERAKRLSNSHAIVANLAYCYTQIGKHQLSLSLTDPLTKHALEQPELRNAAIFNNRGYSYFQLKKPTDAMGQLDRAIELNHNLAVAYENRALTELELLTDDRRKLSAAVKDIEAALILAPNNWGIQRDAATIFAERSIENSSYRQRTRDCLQRVLDFGGDLIEIRDQRCFDHLRSDPIFSKLLDSRVKRRKAEPARTALPFPDSVLP
jgi:serine/threonine protein kinase